MRFSVEQVSRRLESIAEVTGAEPVHRRQPAGRPARATLRFSQIEEVMAGDLQAFLGDIETQCLEVHNAMYETYIAYPIESAVNR